MKGFLKIVLVIIVGLAFGTLLHKWQNGNGSIGTSGHTLVCDTVTVYDTIPYYKPTEIAQTQLGTSVYYLPLYYKPRPDSANVDTCGMSAGGMPRLCVDSTAVEVPIVQKHYRDSTYEAWVSGPIAPNLDSIFVYPRQRTITMREYQPPNKWHLGLTAGYAATPKGFQPYIGIGITYSIISW